MRAARHTVALYGAKRGVGTTTLACNLAVAMRNVTGHDVALVDADFAFGGVCTTMGMPLDEPFRHQRLIGKLTQHDSGVWLAARHSWPIGATGAARAHVLDLVLDSAADRAELVVVDTPSIVSEVTSGVLRRSDRIVLVVTPEEPALEHGRAFLAWCAERDLLDRVKVVVNRSGSQSGLPSQRIESVFGERLIGHLASEGRLVVASVNVGRPFVQSQPGHPLSNQVLDLARALLAERAAATPR
jgi:pilus assembly protein CpaE